MTLGIDNLRLDAPGAVDSPRTVELLRLRPCPTNPARWFRRPGLRVSDGEDVLVIALR